MSIERRIEKLEHEGEVRNPNPGVAIVKPEGILWNGRLFASEGELQKKLPDAMQTIIYIPDNKRPRR